MNAIKEQGKVLIDQSEYLRLKQENEKLKKCVEFYADKYNYTYNGCDVYKTHTEFKKLKDHHIDTEWFEKEERHYSGGVARKTLKEMEQ